MGESKKKVLDSIRGDFVPKTLLCESDLEADAINERITAMGLQFPVIAKPDQGERGRGVERINDVGELKSYKKKYPERIIVQEYITLSLEFGILYYRYPDKDRGNISSVVEKTFLSITGDGHSTLGALIGSKTRAIPRYKYLKEKYGCEWDKVVPSGEYILLEPIGNHSRGTVFKCANHLINDKLVDIFDKIARQIDDYYYGRFDIKVSGLKDLYEGRNIKILELNGVSSEPAHIYDPDYSLIRAYRDIMRHMDIIYDIGKLNYQRGHKRETPMIFIKEMINHLERVRARKKTSSLSQEQ